MRGGREWREGRGKEGGSGEGRGGKRDRRRGEGGKKVGGKGRQ